MILLIATLAGCAFFAYAAVYDVRQTIKGLSYGIWDEGNPDLGKRPSTKKLILRTGGESAVIIACAVLGAFKGWWKLDVFLFPFLGWGGWIHIRGGRKWAGLMADYSKQSKV